MEAKLKVKHAVIFVEVWRIVIMLLKWNVLIFQEKKCHGRITWHNIPFYSPNKTYHFVAKWQLYSHSTLILSRGKKNQRWKSKKKSFLHQNGLFAPCFSDPWQKWINSNRAKKKRCLRRQIQNNPQKRKMTHRKWSQPIKEVRAGGSRKGFADSCSKLFLIHIHDD